jgi:hypothetical protein
VAAIIVASVVIAVPLAVTCIIIKCNQVHKQNVIHVVTRYSNLRYCTVFFSKCTCRRNSYGRSTRCGKYTI